MQDAHCTDSSGKSDCLWRVKCNITGASCPKMDAILTKLDTDKELKMSNTAKNTSAAATPKDVKDKVEEKTVPAQNTAEHDVKPGIADGIKTEETKDAQSEKKVSFVQRFKAVTEKLAKNKKAMILLGGAAVVAGLAIKNNRKALAGEPLDDEDTTVIGVEQPTNPDDTPDSV